MFFNCTSLSITIPSSVTSIGTNAFYKCPLTSITIPIGFKTISQGAFAATNCTSISIPNSVTTIGISAFGQCKKLTSISIPDSVTSIGDQAFTGCAFKSFTIPNGITMIPNLFLADNPLTSIVIPSNITSIGDNAFHTCRQLTSVTLPSNITKISHFAFFQCGSLPTIEIPSSVTSIGVEAFRQCAALTSVTFKGTGLITIDDRAFRECRMLNNFPIPSTVTRIGNSSFDTCNALTSLTFPNGLKSIGIQALLYCGLTDLQLTIPSSMTYIGDSAFTGQSYTELVFAEPCNLTTVGGFAFQYSKISFIDLGKTKLTSIPQQMFFLTSSVQASFGKRTVILPYGITSIGLDAFNNFKNSFELIVIPNTITTLASSCFFYPYTSGVEMTYTCNKLIMFTSSDDGVTKQYYQYIGTMPFMTAAGNTAFNSIITSFNANKTNTNLWSRSFFSAVNAFLPSVENVGVGDTFSVYFYYYIPGVTYSISGVLSSDLSGASLSDTIPEGPSTKTFTVTSGGTKTITFTTSDNATASVYIKPIPYVAITPSASLIYPKPLGSAVLTGGSVLSEIGGNVVAGSFRASPDVSSAIYNVGTYTDVPAIFYPDEINYYSNSSTVFQITINRATTTELQTISVSPTALKTAGYTATELLDANISTPQLKTAGYTATELIEANVTTTDLKTGGYTATELKAANVSTLELKTVGYTATNLKEAN